MNQHVRAIQEERKPIYENIIKWMWRIVLGSIAFVVLLFTILNFSGLPTFEQLENPNNSFASVVYASAGEELGRYFVENRVPVQFDSLSEHLVDALIATEDQRFYKHSGIDLEAIARVASKTILLGDRSSGGGSTITQQLAKLLYSDRDFSGMGKLRKTINLVIIKLKEWITAVKLERNYTKEEILAMYLNKANFVNGAFGIKAASEIYFGKTPKTLSTQEAALLIGMLQNPSLYNPLKRPERATARRNVVLKQMNKNNKLSNAEYEKLKSTPLGLNFKRQAQFVGPAPYFRAELVKELRHILDKPEYYKKDGSKYDIYRDGLKIYTTIDLKYQKYAEQAVAEHMSKLQQRFTQVWKGKDPWTYAETTIPKELRQHSLQKVIRDSDRYQKMRDNYLDEAEDLLRNDIGDFVIKDSDIERIVAESNPDKAIDKLLAEKTIDIPTASAYRKMIDSDNWSNYKSQWRKLQTDVDKAFRTKVKMKIFKYGVPNNERDTIMSPLDSIRYHRMFLQCGSMAVDPTTGFVKAWVGGVNYKYFQFDHVTSDRQVGSTFKPFVYATAIEQSGISPCYEVYDIPYTIRRGEGNFRVSADWTPSNAKGEYSGALLTLKEGLKESKNTVSVYLMKEIIRSTAPVRGLINSMGIDSSARRADGQLRIPDQPSICLGATDLSVYEMTGAYTTFANNGHYNKPIVISRIEDRNGHVIYQELPLEQTAMPTHANYAMVEMLKYATKGTTGIVELKSEVGGKTGTTNDFTDGWFMGITPTLVVGTWVGGEDRWIRFLSLDEGQGSVMAKPIFVKLMKQLEKDGATNYDVGARFSVPPDMSIVLDCWQYKQNTQEEDQFENGDVSDDLFNNKKPSKPTQDDDDFQQ
ncbi:MAG: transglycosylase domain-containing protein [Saprospiraceae bacterium]|nr:transglycosylase domain-containing protein [Saprospiraceae bacterium]MBP7679500.1 transglycosylase domain-containing protein [Saprospiraceae bacterium]